MAAYNAPTNTRHGAQSLKGAPINFTAPHSTINPITLSSSPIIQASSRPVDCRWKRGRPVTFSHRAFTETKAESGTQACAVTGVSDIARRTHGRQEAVASPSEQSHHAEGPGVTATAHPQTTCAGRPSYNAQRGSETTAQMDFAIDGERVVEQCPEAHAMPTSLKDDHNIAQHDRNDADPRVEPEESLAPLRTNSMSNGFDTDYVPSSADESVREMEEDCSQSGDSIEEPTENHIPLDFQIPEDLLRAAMGAPENSKASFWSCNLYRGPDDQKILVHYCKTREVAERVAQHFIGEKVVGFDIEWKPYAHPLSIKHNVSLIQLACEDRIALFHISLFSGTTAAQLMPPTLKTILESPGVYKVGVAVKGDFTRVGKHLGIEPQGIFELSRLNNLVQYHATDPTKVTNKLVGLAVQVQQHLQLPLYKGGHLIDDPEDTSNVRSSDWSLPLNRQQIHYAAADAYAGFRLFDILEEKRKEMRPTPPRPLVCDYDSKPRPRSTDSKPRKKRTVVAKPGETADAVAEGLSAPVEQEEEQGDGDIEHSSKHSQDTDDYETAQEDLLDSHQLEGEEKPSSEERCESADEGKVESSIDLASSSEQQDSTMAAEASERRVGHISLSWLKGPDPDYPILPKLHGDDDVYAPSHEDLVDISERGQEERPHQNMPANNVEDDQETDEFDDSELEEALQNLSIDSDGSLHETSVQPAVNESAVPPAQPEPLLAKNNDPHESPQRHHGDIQAIGSAAPPATEQVPVPLEEEQRLLDLLNDSEVIEYLHTSVEPTDSPSPPTSPAPAPRHPKATPQATQTLEYEQATSWAQSYLASTIPSPSCPVPSHIRATIPHLRAYNMWRHQKLALSEIARLLRDPPLPEVTVGSYVLQAITLEKMDYDEREVRGILMGMPEALRKGKWRALAEKVGAR